MVTLIASLALLAPPKEPTPSIATRVFNYVGPKAARIAPKVRIVLETIVVVCDTANHLVKHTYSKPQIDIATRMTSLKAKLSVEGVDGFAVVSGTDSTWFGSTFMELKAPLTFSYTVDLAQIRPETIRYSPSRKLLEVAMPELEVKEPTVKLEGVTVTKLDKGWGRFDAADGLWRNLIQSEAPSRAREEAMERAAVVRMAARQQVADLIKTTCGQVVPDLIVEIR